MNQTFCDFLKVFAFLLLSFTGNAQNFEWSKVYGGVQSDILFGICQAGSGNYSYAYISTTDIINFKKATITFNTFTLSKNQATADCIAKFDTSGKVVWAKQIFEPGSVVPTSIISDYDDNLYLLGNMTRASDSVRFDVSKSYIKLLKGEFSKIFLIKLDSAGTFIWQKEFPNLVSWTKSLNLIDDNIYLSLGKNNKSKYFISGTDTISDYGVMVKLDSSGKKIYAKGMGQGKNYFTNGELFKVKDSVVFFLQNGYTNYKINNDSIQLKYSSKNMAHIIKVAICETNNKSKIAQITSDGGAEFSLNAVSKINDRQFALSGAFKDSLPVKNYKKIIFPINDLSNTVIIVKDNSVKSHFNLMYSPNMTGGQFLICSSKGQFIYLGGTAVGDFEINGTKTWRKDGINVFCKLDTLCNPLWLFRTGDSTSSFHPSGFLFDNYRGVYFGTTFSNTIRIGGSVLNSSNKSNDFFISKVFDYSITRGIVSKGPYCAGDTFVIPYTREGKYDTSNIFIAQLSDEEGNFEGKERELGRVKSTGDGTIKGILPMFEVESSANYRIRIISTNPMVQSYYKLDSLRLLIYSRDKADPGPDETICFGDSIQLKTYGGTKWTWSPKYNMNDSNLRKPYVWPKKTTTYKIIIADSSGCGKPDTAYKQIYVRPELEVHLNFRDTVLCKNIDLKIPAHFTGGDSNYHWQWYELLVGKQAILLREGKLKLDDTLNYTTQLDSINLSQKLALVLWDECTSKHDTVYINLGWSKPQYLTSKFKDTITCHGPHVSFNATTNAPTGTYHWQWEDMNTNTVLSTFDFLKYKATQTKKIKLSLISACNTDVVIFTVFVKPPLKTSIYSGITVLNDTSICMGQVLKLNGIGKYGDSTNYEFKWYLDKVLFSTTNSLKLNSIDYFKPGDKKTLKLVLNDNCSSWDDSVLKIITVSPAPKADFSYDLACSKTNTKFQFTGTKPQSPVSTGFNWNFNNENTSTLENPYYLFSTAGTKTLTLILSSNNGCRDTLKKTIVIQPQSKANFTTSDVCESDSAVFVNNSKDASGYKWKFGDGQTISTNSTFSTQKHKYQITSTTTFNVTLVAVVADGCSDSVVNAITVNQNPNSDYTATQNGNKLELKAKAGYATYKWLFDTDSITVNQPNYTYTLKAWSPIKVCLTATDNASCQGQSCKTITLGISKPEKQSGFKLYPNPNAGNFSIEIENPSNDISIEVYDVIGNLIKTVETHPNKKSYSIEMNVADGIYLVKVRNNGGFNISYFIKRSI